MTYQFSSFIVSPSNCAVSYTHNSVPSLPDLTLSSGTRTFGLSTSDFSYTSLSAPYYIDYTVTVTGTSFTLTATDTFKIRIMNPCIETSTTESAETSVTIDYAIG